MTIVQNLFRFAGFPFLLFCVLILPAYSQDPLSLEACDLEQGQSGIVSRIIDGDTFVLESGLTVRLIGAAAPKAGASTSETELANIMDQAKTLLKNLTLGREIQLFFGGTRSDRYRRALAHVFVSVNGSRVWIQQAMVAAGMARIYSFKDNRACIRDLQRAESEARAARLGLWILPQFAVSSAQNPAKLLDLVDTFQIIEGKIISAHAVNNRVYLNFGQVWREDFTGSISRRDYTRFREEGFDLVALEGQMVRIRGWIEERGGPMIVLTHPEQLEFAGDS